MTKHSPEARERAWPPERRAAQAERMRSRNADEDANATRVAALRASLRAQAQVVALGKSRRGSRLPAVEYGRKVLHLILINRDPTIRAKATATKRAGRVPQGYRRRYLQLRDRVGPEVAMKIVLREAANVWVDQ